MSWKEKSLGEIAHFQRGLTYSKKDEADTSNNIVLRATNLRLEDNSLDLSELKFLKNTIEIDEKKKVKKDSLLICLSSGSKKHLGKVAFVDDNYDAYFGGFIGQITPKEGTDSRFLYYLLVSDFYKQYISNLSDSANINNLRMDDLKAFKVPYPPISEQKRIVAALDEAFVAIDKAKENTEQNLQNAKDLFESYLQSVFEKKGDGWQENSLAEIADVEYGYTDKSTDEGDYRYVRITDIDKNGELILDNKKYINHSKEAERFLIQDRDLLMARTGATFAKVLLFKGDEPSVFASYLIRIKFNESIVNALYWYFTKTRYYWEQANNLKSGAAQPHFNGAAVKKVVFIYPKSLSEQNKLIEKFEILSIKTKKLEAIYLKKLEELEEFKKSILKEAVAGELITSKIEVSA